MGRGISGFVFLRPFATKMRGLYVGMLQGGHTKPTKANLLPQYPYKKKSETRRAVISSTPDVEKCRLFKLAFKTNDFPVIDKSYIVKNKYRVHLAVFPHYLVKNLCMYLNEQGEIDISNPCQLSSAVFPKRIIDYIIISANPAPHPLR